MRERKDTKYFYQFRVIIIGDSTVGKSSLLRQFTEGQFIESSDPTVGVDFHVRVLQLNENIRVKLQLWDTAGQERFRSITKTYYRNCAGCLIVYDISNRESFEHARDWLYEAHQSIDDQNVVFLLIGHKVDLDYQREVTTSEGEAFANAHDMIFMETSAKVLCNVEEAFLCVTKEIYRRLVEGDIDQKEGWDGIKTIPFRPTGLYVSNENLTGHDDGHRRCCR